ncbi:MAG TPA: carboxypeptidase-like regulatory domain-containing protein, partial [Terriglobia bacterium]|nr:carboxypeptidase-like regulatory domain-containing protein [Terriglobia bacterium]
SPLSSASVKVKNSAGTTLKEMDTDRAGRFVIPDLPGGEYLVSISKSNYSTINVRMTAQPDAAPVPVLRMIKFGVISGHITSPRTGGSVTVIEQVSEGQIPRTFSATINPAGEFRIFGIPPGRYLLTAPLTAATASGPVRGMAIYPNHSRPREFVITGGEEYSIPEFALPADSMSSISGKVTGPGTPQIFSLALVESAHPSIRLMVALTQEGGAFRFDSILPGTYDLIATGPVTPAPSLFAHTRLVLNSQKVDNLDLVLKPGRSIEFSVDAESRCAADGTLTLQAIGSWALVRDLKLTKPISPTSPARFENVAPGPFNVSVQGSSGKCIGVASTGIDLRNDAPPEHATVVFHPLSSIHGPTSFGNIMVLRDVTAGRESAPTIDAIVGNTAKDFRFDDLLPGQYCLTTMSATDVIPHWSPETGCSTPIIELAPGESKGL